ncbi:MAG: hypothetical protein AAF664_16510, partial [Planctomycetota bacterium]
MAFIPISISPISPALEFNPEPFRYSRVWRLTRASGLAAERRQHLCRGAGPTDDGISLLSQAARSAAIGGRTG